MAARFLPAGLLCGGTGKVSLSSLQGCQPAHGIAPKIHPLNYSARLIGAGGSISADGKAEFPRRADDRRNELFKPRGFDPACGAGH